MRRRTGHRHTPNPLRRLWIIAGIGLCSVIALWAYAGTQVLTYASETYDGHADVAIVLGAAVWQDKPTPVFEERIKHGINLYQRGAVEVLIFTGGVGWGDELAESEVDY